jgi:hypothetical protein
MQVMAARQNMLRTMIQFASRDGKPRRVGFIEADSSDGRYRIAVVGYISLDVAAVDIFDRKVRTVQPLCK